MNSLTTFAAGLLLAATSFIAHSDDMDYRYFQLSYVEHDSNLPVGEPEGMGTKGSFGFAENFFVFTEVNKTEESGIDIDQYAIGLGGHYGLSNDVDLVGRAGWAKNKLDTTSLGADGEGYLVGVGLRARAGEHVELEAGAIYIDFGREGDEVGAEVAARFHFNRRWAVALDYQDLGDLSTVMAGVRYSFSP